MSALLGIAVLIVVGVVLMLGVRWLQSRSVDRQQERAIREYLRRQRS